MAHIGNMMIVPYEPYASKRKQYGWRRKPVIQFFSHGSPGICLDSALHHRSPGLENPQEAVLAGCGDKVSYHVHLLGYTVFKCQKYSYYQKHGTKYPNTRMKVARQIAEAIQDFIDKRQYEHHEEIWRVGPGYLELKDLYLLELRHVATGCFQPILGVRLPQVHHPAAYYDMHVRLEGPL